jgi:transposase InsO family protein
LLTDAYSQKIVGWHISLDLKADSAVKALRSALRSNKGRIDELIHHSDRGVQYCSKKYVKLLKDNEINISMTKPAAPQENAIAERINGILKEEWLHDADIDNISSVREQIRAIVNIYNTYRPHNSLNKEVPTNIHDMGFSRYKAERVIGKM